MNQQQQPPPLDKEIQGIAMLALWVTFAANLPLRIFTRIPGTMGPMVLFPYSIFIGWFTLLFTSTLILGSDGNLHPFWFCQLGAMWTTVHIVAHVIAHVNGKGVHNHCTGASWLNLVVINGCPDLIAAHGDALFAGILAAVFYALDSPSFASWFVVNIGLAYFAYFAVLARDTIRQTGVTTSLVDNQYWLNLLKRAERDMDDLE